MNFALIGDHPDGLNAAAALAASGKHALVAYAGPTHDAEILRQRGLSFKQVRDVEELLARPEIELVIVADTLEHRPAVLRRAAQAEKHVLCVHPADLLPDVAYEVAMIQKDTKKLVLPLLADRFAPGLVRLRQLCNDGTLGKLQSLECEWPVNAPRPSGERGGGEGAWEISPLLRLWDAIRALGGEVAEVSALAVAEEVGPNDTLTLTGRFQEGGLFQVLLVKGATRPGCRLRIRGEHGEALLTCPDGWYGPARLEYPGLGETRAETWDAWDPVPVWINQLHQALAGRPGHAANPHWLDATRCLELFDAARRSAAKRRVVPMVYEEFTEVSTFKSAMTSIGCGLLVLGTLLFILGVGFRWPRWAVHSLIGCLVLFLVLQALRLIVLQEEPHRRSISVDRSEPEG